MFNMTPIHFNIPFVAFPYRTIVKIWCESKLTNNSTRTWTLWYNNKVTRYILLLLLLNDIGIMLDLTIYLTIWKYMDTDNKACYAVTTHTWKTYYNFETGDIQTFIKIFFIAFMNTACCRRLSPTFSNNLYNYFVLISIYIYIGISCIWTVSIFFFGDSVES